MTEGIIIISYCGSGEDTEVYGEDQEKECIQQQS